MLQNSNAQIPVDAAGDPRLKPLVTVITARGLNFNGFGEIWRARELIRMLVYRNLISKYKQTILGPLYLVLMPLLNALVFTVIFGNIVGVKTDGMPQFVFFLAGTICWSFLSQTFDGVGQTFIANAGLITKVYFPRIAIPLSTILTNAFSSLVHIVVLICAMVLFILRGDLPIPNIADIWVLPLVFLQLSMTAVGLGCLFAAITVTYRDLSFLSTLLVQFWMYATPVVYPVSLIPEKYRLFYALNPASGSVDLFRSFVAGRAIHLTEFHAIGWAVLTVLTFLGLWLFFQAERDFADRI
ncbi:MAG: ABC transporter permease [Spirochaetia bacterium]|nr:ABC transporter permease [Spirochaetia bacterium]